MAEPAQAAGDSATGGGDTRKQPPLAILNYGMGNLRSVEKAFARVGVGAVVTEDRATIEAAPGLILPGVGAFPRAMGRIRERGWDGLIPERVAAGIPVLGICLGFQLIFDGSTEFGGDRGLGLVGGEVKPLEIPGLKVPHIGWEPVSWDRESDLTEGVPSGTAFYFVHSLAPRPGREGDRLGYVALTYTAGCSASRPGTPGGDADGVKHQDAGGFVAAVERGNVFGVQFHPEKSSAAGLRLLTNFAAICAAGGRR